MSETKFTQGPWNAMCISDEIVPQEVLKEKRRRDCHCGYVFYHDKCVAQVFHNDERLPNFEHLSGEILLEEKNANANLIAAAPELYEVLEEIGDMHVLNGLTVGKRVDAILAKARGEKPT